MESTTCTSETSSDESVNPDRPFACNYKNCKAKFSKNSKLVIHIRTHTGERPFTCSKANCKKAYTNSTHLKRHQMISHEGKNEKIQCTAEGCNLWLNVVNLKRHIYRMHNPDRKYPFTCKYCKEGFSKKRVLQKHTYIHTGELPFKCDICNQKFMTLNECNKHKRIHTCYECECGNVFERWSNLLKHRKSCSKRRFKCEECKKDFKSNRLLMFHIKTHADLTEREVFACDYEDCERIYLYKKNLINHIDTFHKHIKKNEIPCPFEGCNKSLSKMQNLKLHLKIHDMKTVMNKSKKERKDKGLPKKCAAAEILGLNLPKEMHKKIIAGIPVELEYAGDRNTVETTNCSSTSLNQEMVLITSKCNLASRNNEGMENSCSSPIQSSS